MLDRVWELRHHLSAHDAAYVALAEGLRCRLVTRDASDQSSAWAALPGDSVARLTESWPQMLTELGLFKQISPHCAKFLINHADRGFDDKRLRNSLYGVSGFRLYVNHPTVYAAHA